MRPSAAAPALALLLATVVPGAVGADQEPCILVEGAETTDTADDVEACRTPVWFHEADTKVGNLAGQGYGIPGWDGNAPTASVTTGAGGGYFGTSAWQLTDAWDPTYTPAFEGSLDGAVDNLLIDLYLFPPQAMAENAAGQGGTSFRVDANLYVDGDLVAQHGDLTMDLEDAGDAVKKVQFAFVDLYDPAIGDGPHDLRLEVVGTGLASNGAVWVYDTTEVPSGIVFNATDAELDGVAGNPDWPF